MLKKWILPLLKALVTLGLLGFLASKLDLERMAELLGQTSIPLFIAACAVMFLQGLLAIVRWRQILAWKDVSATAGQALRYFWLGLFFNQILPSSVGGDAVRSYCLVRDGCGIGRATVSVLLDRLSGMMGLVVLILTTLPLAFGLIGDSTMNWGIVLIVTAASVGMTFLFFLDRITSRFPRWRVAQGLTTLSRDSRRLFFSRGDGLRLAVLSILIHLFSIVAMGLLAAALKIDPHWTALFVVVPLATLFMTVPISVAGWGVREGVMIVGLGFAGIGAEQAVALSILFGLLLVIVALPGGFVWLVQGRYWKMDMKRMGPDGA